MNSKQMLDTAVSRRRFVKASVAGSGGLAIAFYMPVAGAAMAPWDIDESGTELNAWLVIDTDDVVTIRVAQSEMGEGNPEFPAEQLIRHTMDMLTSSISA